MDKIRVLHIGGADWTTRYTIPESVALTQIDEFPEESELSDQEEHLEEIVVEAGSLQAAEEVLSEVEEGMQKHYELIFVDRDLTAEECEKVHSLADAYRLYVLTSVQQGADLQFLMKRMVGETIAEDAVQDFLLNETVFFFKKPYGERMPLEMLAVSSSYTGKVTWDGYYGVELQGDFGNKFHQVFYFMRPVPIEPKQILEFWMEYEKTDGVEVKLKVSYYPGGAAELIEPIYKEYSEEELRDCVLLENSTDDRKYIFASIELRGEGTFKMLSLHSRYSRGKYGHFLPGGKRFVSKKREELFYYFDPGDLKPPLNVYFSGFKTQEGFEGYFTMKEKNAPFLLIADARVLGGSFYVGDEEYEEAVIRVITEHLEELGFSKSDLVLSGLSMGTTAALYYGSKLEPRAILVGKPLMNLGTIAANERLNRPHGWGTSLDILKFLTGGREESDIEALNQKLWDAFDKANFDHTKLVIAYMREDDYDIHAYNMILEHLYDAGVEVYGKGLTGRHNDDTGGIAVWFLKQLEEILDVDFHRAALNAPAAAKEGENHER